MKIFHVFSAVIITLFATCPLFSQDIQSYTDSIQNLRVEKQNELKSRKTSPLLKADRKAFKHLNYYDVEPMYNVDAFYVRIENGAVYDIATSNGAIKKFQKHGVFVFQIHGRLDSLYAFKRIYPEGFTPNYPPYLFVPFKDQTTGNETYGGGRYLETEVFETDQQVKLDFNLCYNPYCAYGSGFSCPIPPEENFVNFKVEAGEKAYAQDH